MDTIKIEFNSKEIEDLIDSVALSIVKNDEYSKSSCHSVDMVFCRIEKERLKTLLKKLLDYKIE